MVASHTQQKSPKTQTTLYVLVFETPQIKIAAAVLLGFMLIQPITPVFAATQLSNEEEPTSTVHDEKVIEEVTTDETPAPEVSEENQLQTKTDFEKAPENDDNHTNVVQATNEVSSTTVNTHERETPVLSGTTTESAMVTDDDFSSASSSEILESGNNTGSSTATTTSSNSSTSTPAVDGGATSGGADDTPTSTAEETVSTSTSQTIPEEDTTHVSDDDAEQIDVELKNDEGTTSASSTESLSDETVKVIASTTPNATSTARTPKVAPVSYVNNNLNAHQFATDDCVSVGDGSFYCSSNETAPEFVEDRVYVAQDADGDDEIFIQLQGESQQITHNIVDDAAPYYDALSGRLVYHTMKNDRFQVVSYSLEDDEFVYLTDTSYNNMEPVAYGEITLWQAWIENNWEIIKYENGSTTQLTHNTMHDISPHMRGGHVLWQTQFSDGWKVAVYNVESDSVEYIASGDGSKVENPRMMLVYDSTNSNGDVQTLGYDFDSKSAFPLHALPTDIPTELPDPEQTGETRALLQSKTSSRETFADANDGDDLIKDTTNATTSDPLTLDMATSSQKNSETQKLSANEVLNSLIADKRSAKASSSITIDDIVVASSTEAISPNNERIPDVVIPPTVSSTTQEVG